MKILTTPALSIIRGVPSSVKPAQDRYELGDKATGIGDPKRCFLKDFKFKIIVDKHCCPKTPASRKTN